MPFRKEKGKDLRVFYLYTYSSVSSENHACMYYRKAGEPYKFLLSFNRPFCVLDAYKNTDTHTRASLTVGEA